MRREAKAMVAAASLSLAVGCGSAAEPAGAAGESQAVETAMATVRRVSDTLEAGGVLHGQAHAAVASRLMATVVSVDVRPGDRVRAGQRLVHLDDRDLVAALQEAGASEAVAARRLDGARSEQTAAEAAAALARTTFSRIAALHARRGATDQERDEAQSAVHVATSRLAAAEAGVAEAEAGVASAAARRDAATVTASFAQVVAPFDGVVTEKLVEPGTLVRAGELLVRVEDTSVLELEVRVDESRAAWVTAGSRVPVIVDAPDGEVEHVAHVTEMSRAVATDDRAVLVTLRLESATALRPGTFGRARFPGPRHPSLVVPSAAVVQRGQLTSVFVADDGRARLRLVRIGRQLDEDTEVLAGLSDGEAVVVGPAPSLADGAAITTRTGAGGPS